MAGEAEKVCSAEGCGRRLYAKGLCKGHHNQQWKGQEIRPLKEMAPKGTRPKRCSFPGCNKAHSARGYCRGHYTQFKKGYTLQPLKTPGRGVCTFDGCGRERYGLGLCSAHYQQKKAGRPLSPVQVPLWGPRASLAERVTAYVSRSETTPEGCILWAGPKNSDGYGKLLDKDGKFWLAHRAVYFVEHGGLDKSLPLHHTCANRACVSTDHVVPVTQAQNTAEMLARNYYEKSIKRHVKEIRSLRAELDDLRFEVAALDDFLASCGLEEEFAAWCAEQEENDLDPT